MVLKYYYDLISQPCRALYIYMKVNKIPFESFPIALGKGEHRTEEYKQLNPVKKVPLIIHDGFKLTESVGILRYLSREFDTPDHWYPKSSQEQAKVDEFLEWQHGNLRTYGTLVAMHKILIPMLTQKPVDEAKVERFHKELQKVLDVMEKMFLKETPFLNRNKISISDLIGACEIEMPMAAGYDVVASRPILKDWLERVKGQVQPYYDEAHIYSEKLKQKTAQK